MFFRLLWIRPQYVSKVRITSSCIITHQSVLLTYCQSSYWKIYPERTKRVTIQSKSNCVARLANAFTPYTRLSVILILSPSISLTHSHHHAFSHSNEYCVVRSHCPLLCVTQFMGLLAFKWPFKMFC